MALPPSMTTAYGDELCGDPDHDPNHGDRWHITRPANGGTPTASPCPIAAERDRRNREAAIQHAHQQDRYEP